MKRFLTLLVTLCFSVGFANAAVRSESGIARTAKSNPLSTGRQTAARTTVNRTSGNTRNTTTQNSRSATIQRISNARSALNMRNTTQSTSARTAVQQNQRTTSTARNASVSRAQSSRSATPQNITARAASTASPSAIFGVNYDTCRDAYFTCMDQFCAMADDTYRRCVCSSKLTEIQSRERALTQASNQIQDFKAFNITAIDKTAAEVGAMVSATAGEQAQANAKDTSNSAQQLAGISDVLSNTKTKALSTQGSLDIAGDINQIWNTTELTGGANIANLTGEALYNAVHAQCSEMVNDVCGSGPIKTMVTSAYGMYIENDCSLMINALDKQLITANSTIRETEREMGTARLENYNAHNSTSINDCIANVRQDITANTACGTDYVHCLDITGKYLNYETGAPIYSPEFFHLNNQISLSGDILTNPINRLLIARLDSMRDYASRGLDTCRDLSDDVWDEFKRQAVKEIYQGQQERIRLVKNECLEVVNKCYDEQKQSLKDFSNIAETTLLGSRLELSEEMCQEKLDACSNLYGGGTSGMQELVTAMYDITSQQIAQQCQTALREFAKELCSVPNNDTLHSYPYACRVYAPGDQMFASNPNCNTTTAPDTQVKDILHKLLNQEEPKYVCRAKKRYTSCKPGYYYIKSKFDCLPCPRNMTCDGNKSAPKPANCGTDYIGSLYQKMVKYASQVCVRPSEADDSLPNTVLQDINVVMDELRISMSDALASECERLGGIWVDTPYESTGDLHKEFYNETSANLVWGYCTQQ